MICFAKTEYDHDRYIPPLFTNPLSLSSNLLQISGSQSTYLMLGMVTSQVGEEIRRESCDRFRPFAIHSAEN